MTVLKRDSCRRPLLTLLITAFLLLLQGCGGGSCSRRDVVEGDKLPPATMPDDVDEVYNTPIKFDFQSLDDALHELKSGEQLSQVDIARIIVVTESAVDFLHSALIELKRNEDNADTWHVFTEFDQKGLSAKCVEIVRLLGGMPLDATAVSHLEDLKEAMARTENMLPWFYATVPNLPRLSLEY